MKITLMIFLLLLGSQGFSQEGVTVKENTLSMREIPPVWPGCEGTAEETKLCFNKKLVELIKEHYKFPRDSEGNYIRGKAVVSFIINEEGLVEILKVEGSKGALNEEAKRIIMAIPKMKPGQLGGKAIAVKYMVPFTF